MSSHETMYSLLEVIWKVGQCGEGVNVDMSPTKPPQTAGPEAQQEYEKKLSRARAVCIGCPATRACYVYSSSMRVNGVYAVDLSLEESHALNSVMANPAALQRFVADELSKVQ